MSVSHAFLLIPKRSTHLCRWVMLSLLTACAHTPEPIDPLFLPPSIDTPSWRLVGKISVVDDQQLETANMQWRRHTLQRDTLTLAGPMGVGAMRFERDGHQLFWLNDDEREPLSTLNLSSPLQRALTHLPFVDLGDWLLGHIPEPPASAAEERQWQVQVTRWQTLAAQRLPRVMQLTYGKVVVRIVILDWYG